MPARHESHAIERLDGELMRRCMIARVIRVFLPVCRSRPKAR